MDQPELEPQTLLQTTEEEEEPQTNPPNQPFPDPLNPPNVPPPITSKEKSKTSEFYPKQSVLQSSFPGLVEVPIEDGGGGLPELNFPIEKKWHVEIPWYKSVVTKDNRNYTVFTIRVYFGEVKWVVEKRFRDCFAFSELLVRKYEGVPAFPPRQPKFLHDTKFLQLRQLELESYFQKFDQSAFSSEEMRNFLNAYTELKKNGIYIKTDRPRLREIIPGSGVFVNDSTIVTSGLTLPLRMTVVKLTDGNLLLYSPTKLDNALFSELEDFGTVRYIIAPNKIHHTYVQNYLEAFPEVVLYLAPGLSELEGFKNGKPLGDHPEPEWEKELDQLLTQGNSFFSEVVLFHRSSRILILADFMFNFLPGFLESQDSTVTAFTFFFTGIPDRPMCSPEHTIYCTNTQAFQSTYEKMMAWNFSCIIMSHGVIITDPEKAKEALSSAYDNVIHKVSERWEVTNSLFSFVGGKKNF